MSEVERLVGVRRRVFNHDEWRVFSCGFLAVVGVAVHLSEELLPCLGGDGEVQEALHDVVFLNDTAVRHEILAYLLCHILRAFARRLDKGEHYEGYASLKLAAGLLQLDHLL